MSTDKFLSLLKSGAIEEFNAIRPAQLDLFAVDLSNAQLMNADLSNVNLEKSDLSDANLEGANLMKARLKGADMCNTNFRSITAARSKWDEAYAENADFSDADLSGASMNEIEMSDVIFERAIMENTYMKGAVLSKCDFSGAEMVRTRLTGCDATKSNFSYAILNGIKMAKATLSECSFERSEMVGALFAESTLKGSDLTEANLQHANFNDSDLRGITLNNTRLTRADLTGANIEGVDFSHSQTDEIASDLGLFPLAKAPAAPHIFIEEPVTCVSGGVVAISWVNHESPKKHIRIIRAKINQSKAVEAIALPSPADLVVARDLIAIPSGFISMVIEERPSGKFAIFDRIPFSGDPIRFSRIKLNYATAPLNEMGKMPNYKLIINKGILYLYVIARNSPKIRVHAVKTTGESAENAYDIPTIRGLVGDKEAVALTKGGTLAVLGPRGPEDMLSCPPAFPGRRCDVISGDSPSVTWLDAPNDDGMAKLGAFWADLNDEGAPFRFHRKKLVQQISLSQHKDDVWLACMLEPSGFEPAEVWVSLANSVGSYQVTGKGSECDEDVDRIHMKADENGAYLVASTISGSVLVFKLNEESAKLSNTIK